MDKLKMESLDITKYNIEKIGALFPNVLTETKDENGNLVKAINFDKLKQELTDDIVDGSDESYDFTWVGKTQAIIEANTPIRKTLRPVVEDETVATGADSKGNPYISSGSKNFDTTENLYIEGDNFEVLKLLQESYLNSIKMIYIDPPYNTGKDSFVYPDNFAMDKDEYEEEIEYRDENGNIQFKQNNKANPKFHSDWCSMIYQRLKLAKNLLTDDGVIFIHIDENEVYNMINICNEVFGQSNDLGTIIWDKRNPKGSSVGVAYQHESILVYCKNKSEFSKTPFTKAKENSESMIQKVTALVNKYGSVNETVKSEYKKWLKDNKSNFSGGELAYSLIDDNGNIYQPVSMAAPDRPETRSHRPLFHPVTNKHCPTPAKGWRFTDAKMDELLKNNKIEFGDDETTQPRQKYYLKDNLEEMFSSLLYFGGSDDAMGLHFDNPKPVYVGSKIVSSVCKGGNDIILDFFSGSATTAHAVMQLNAEDGGNRKFIMVQLPEVTDEKSEARKANYNYITEIGKERIRCAGEKIKEEVEQDNAQLKHGEKQKKVPDIGFRVLKCDSTNMKEVYYSANEYSQVTLDDMISNIKEDRNALDLLYGVLLDWGIQLSSNCETLTIDGITVYNYDEGSLIACLDNKKVSETAIREIAKMQPLRVVFRDSSFANSPDKINVEEIFKLNAPNTSVRVI